MKWFDCQKDKLPDHDQEVLINVGGEHYIARYDGDKKMFHLDDEQLETRFFAEKQLVFWREYERRN